MSLFKTLNMKQPDKPVKVVGKLSEEKKINKLFKDAMVTAIQNNAELKKYYHKDLPQCIAYVQTTNKETKKEETLTRDVGGECIVIPTTNVTFKHGDKVHTLDTAFKVGTIQSYIEGIAKQVIEFIPTKK